MAERLLGVWGSDGRIFWRPGGGQGLPCPPTLLAAARVRDCGQEKSRLSAGLSGLLEAEKEQAGAIGGTAPISAQHYPFGISSLLPEMTWPGQRGCQEDTAAGREKGGRTNRWQLETHPSEALLPSHSQGSHACCSCPPVSPLWVWAQEVRS